MKYFIILGFLFFANYSFAQKYNFEKMESIPIKAKFNMKLPLQTFKRYVDNSDSRAETDVLFEKIIKDISKKDSLIKPLFRFEWQSGDVKYTTIKYNDKDLKNQVKLYSFNKYWVEIAKPTKKIEIFFYDFCKVITLDLYNLLTSSTSDSNDIPEIDAIKAKFKDAEGILDIDKLGAYLKTKPKELAKYCDY